MATITLAADTNYSALTVANDDTIDCDGFILTLDEQPTETGVQVTSPGTNGRVVFDGGWNLSTWDFFAGESTTAGMIGTLPADATIKSITGGSITNARGIATNSGTVTTATGGDAAAADGITTNTGIVTNSNGGAAARGVFTNRGLITTATGGSGSGGHGVNINEGTVITSIGGSHSLARGIDTNNGLCLRLTDNTGSAVRLWRGDTCFVEGPHIDGIIPDNIKTIYSLGTLSASATIAVDATVIELSKGKGLTGIR